MRTSIRAVATAAGLAATVAIVAAAGCSGGGISSGSNVEVGQTVVDLTDAVSQLRQDNAALQEQIDSLRTQVARQDTLLTRITAAAGIAR